MVRQAWQCEVCRVEACYGRRGGVRLVVVCRVVAREGMAGVALRVWVFQVKAWSGRYGSFRRGKDGLES